MAEVVIIGGGISGLSAAYHLLQEPQPCGVTIMEASARLGGVLHTVKDDGFVVELGSDSFITNKPWARELCLNLDLQDEIVETNEANRRSLIAYKGKLIPVPDGFRLIAPTRFWPFVTSELFSWSGKFRVGLELLAPPRRSHDDESVADFVRRRFGSELLARAAQPMVGGIYTGDVSELSAQSTLPDFVTLEEKYGSVISGLRQNEKQKSHLASGARYAIFNSLAPGVGALVDRLAKRLAEKLPTNRVLLNCKVVSIEVDGQGRWKIICADGTSVLADAVILAIAACQAGLLLERIDPALGACLRRIESASSVVINFLFRREDLGHLIRGFGFVVPSLENRSIIAVSAISTKFENRAPKEMVMLRVFMGGSLNHDLNQLNDEDLRIIALAELNSYLQIKSEPVKSWLRRWPESMPQYKVGHRLLIAEIGQLLKRHPRLALSGNSYDGVGIPDCIRSGMEAALKTSTCLHARPLLTN